MSYAIWKYPLPNPAGNYISCPMGSRPLSVSVDPRDATGVVVYMKVPIDSDAEDQLFFNLSPTGDTQDGGMEFLGTVILIQAREAWHVYWDNPEVDSSDPDDGLVKQKPLAIPNTKKRVLPGKTPIRKIRRPKLS